MEFVTYKKRNNPHRKIEVCPKPLVLTFLRRATLEVARGDHTRAWLDEDAHLFRSYTSPAPHQILPSKIRRAPPNKGHVAQKQKKLHGGGVGGHVGLFYMKWGSYDGRLQTDLRGTRIQLVLMLDVRLGGHLPRRTRRQSCKYFQAVMESHDAGLLFVLLTHLEELDPLNKLQQYHDRTPRNASFL